MIMPLYGATIGTVAKMVHLWTILVKMIKKVRVVKDSQKVGPKKVKQQSKHGQTIQQRVVKGSLHGMTPMRKWSNSGQTLKMVKES